MCCGRNLASDARGVSLKNVAQRGDRGVGDWDPCRAPEDDFLEAMFFRVVERFAEQHVSGLRPRQTIQTKSPELNPIDLTRVVRADTGRMPVTWSAW